MGIKYCELKTNPLAVPLTNIPEVVVIEVDHIDSSCMSVMKFIADNKTKTDNLLELLVEFKLVLNKEDVPIVFLNDDDLTVSCTTNIRIDLDKDNKEKITDQIKKLKNKGIPDTVWNNNASRIALLVKRSIITIEQFLTRYTDAEDKKMNINDIAKAIRDKFKQYDIVLCTKPEDYAIMYDVKTGSCMDMSAYKDQTYDYVGPNHWWKVRRATNMHPASWYHYTKTSKGGYIMDRKIPERPVARFMLYADKDGNFTEYSDVKIQYSAITAEKVSKLLKDAGYTYRGGYWNLTEPFRIPAVEHNKELMCPFPYGDYVQGTFDVAFDPATKEFVFDKAGVFKSPCANKYSYNGYIRHNQVKQLGEVKEAKKKAA